MAGEELPGCTDNFRLKSTFAPLLSYLTAGVEVRRQWVVKQVDYSSAERVRVTNQRGEVCAVFTVDALS